MAGDRDIGGHAMNANALTAIAKVIEGAKEWKPADEACAALPTNDLGNSERLMMRFGERLIFAPELAGNKMSGWLGWTGTHWSLEEGDRLAQRAAQQTALAMREELAFLMWKGPRELLNGTPESKAQFSDRLEAFAKAAHNAANVPKLNGMLACARPHLMRRRSVFNRDLDKLTVGNGTLYFDPTRPEGGPDADQDPQAWRVEKLPHRPEDLITCLAPVEYDPKATCPEFDRFLATVQPDPERRAFLLRFAGYVLTGHCSEQVMLLLFGMGMNGKSTFLTVLELLLGTYAGKLPIAALLEQEHKTGGEAVPELARLIFCRFVHTGEPEPGHRLSAKRVKELTGQDTISARPLYGDFFEFAPQFKIALSFNRKPDVRAGDHGMWRRIPLLGWDVTIPKAEAIDDYAHKLVAAEGPGILNRLIEGYRQWRVRRLDVPEVVSDATDEYREESNALAEWIAERTRPPAAGKDGWTQATALWKDYAQWCKDISRRPMPSRAFYQALVENGFKRVKRSVSGYLDILIKGDPDALVYPDDKAGGPSSGGSMLV